MQKRKKVIDDVVGRSDARYSFDVIVRFAESVKKPPEPPADPLTAAVVPNKDVVIEINVTGFKALGLFLIGGKMLEAPEAAAYVVMIYPDGAAKKDARLAIFDRITEIEGKKLTAEMSADEMRKLFRHANARVGSIYIIMFILKY